MGGYWVTENESPNNCWRCSRHAAVCYQTRESPSSGKCCIFCYRLTYISKMCSMHTKHFCWNSRNSNRKLFANGVPILPWMGPHVSFNSTWQLSSSPRLQWQHVIIGQRTLMWWCMDVCIQYHCGTITMSAEYPPIPITWLWCQYPDEVAHLQPQPVSGRGVIIVQASILITLLLSDKIWNEQINLHHLSDWWNQTINKNHEMR